MILLHLIYDTIREARSPKKLRLFHKCKRSNCVAQKQKQRSEKLYCSLADPGGARNAPQSNSFIFKQFWEIFGQIIGLHPKL